jgi:hypothetical protein
VVALVRAVGQLLAALALAPVLVCLLGLALLFALLPIPQVRTFMLAVQSRLTATVGDCLAFVESPIRASMIRTRILDGLERLAQLCKYTVIVAHSQGAAAVSDALGGFLELGEQPEELSKQREPEPTRRLVPDALVTFGAGINQLASQKVLAAGLPGIGFNPVCVCRDSLGEYRIVALVVLERPVSANDGREHPFRPLA